MENVVFLDVAPCASCKNWRFGGMFRLHHQGDKNQLTRNNVNPNKRRLLVTANVVPSSPILVTLMMETLSSSETSPQGVTSQKTAFFIVTAVKTSNLTKFALLFGYLHPSYTPSPLQPHDVCLTLIYLCTVMLVASNCIATNLLASFTDSSSSSLRSILKITIRD
jgi:hypothetical protein